MTGRVTEPEDRPFHLNVRELLAVQVAAKDICVRAVASRDSRDDSTSDDSRMPEEIVAPCVESA